MSIGRATGSFDRAFSIEAMLSSSKTIILCFCLFVCAQCVSSSRQQLYQVDPPGYWYDVVDTIGGPGGKELPRQYRLLKMNMDQLNATLATLDEPHVILPHLDTGFFTIKVKKAPILPTRLANKYPGIRSYQGVDLQAGLIDARVDINSAGFFAMVTTRSGIYFVNPISTGSEYHVCYDREHAPRGMGNPFHEY